MRYRLVVLMLFALASVMNVLAAPAPEPYAILDIGPPPKGEEAEQYCKRLIGAQTHQVTLNGVWSDPAVKKLPSIAGFKDPRPWMAKNLRVTSEQAERRIRFTFRGGTRDEQVAILNAFLRDNLSVAEEAIKRDKEWQRVQEKNVLELKQRLKSTTNPQEAASFQKGIDNLRWVQLPKTRTDIARWKQLAAIKWAR